MGNIDGSWSLYFLAASLLVIITVSTVWTHGPTVRDWFRERKRVKYLKREYAENEVRIEDLQVAYRMQVAGRALRANGIDREVKYFQDWLDQESKLLDDRQLDRLIPVQEKLLYTLDYATKRRHTGVSPAEFRDVVEGRRRQPVT